MQKIYRFEPYLKPVIWGGDKLEKYKGVAEGRGDIGESWEISAVTDHPSVVADGQEQGTDLRTLIDRHGAALVSNRVVKEHGNEFPLLVKLIDARDNLSVQVHPDDTLARRRHNCCGKTEMWYILETEPDALIHAGLSARIDADEYTRRVADNSIMDVVKAHPAHPGDVFFLPAGRVHAIGAGNLLLEIQQTSDITYRIYDYDRRDAQGNPRELHTDQARDAIDYTVYPEYRTYYDREAPEVVLASCPYFTVKKITVKGEADIVPADDSFTIVTCVDGSCTVTADGQSVKLDKYQTILIAAAARTIHAEGTATLITASI